MTTRIFLTTAVALGLGQAALAAPPSWRQTMLRMPLSTSPSSAARKLSPGTENTRYLDTKARKSGHLLA